MQYYRKALERAVNKLYELRTKCLDAGDCRNRGNLTFADKLARKHASGEGEVLAELFDEKPQFSCRSKFVLTVHQGNLALELRPVRYRFLQQGLFGYGIADAERTECFAHLVLLRDGEALKAGEDQRLGRLCNCRNLCDCLFFLLPCNGHMFFWQ